jgi:hypothetical protein
MELPTTIQDCQELIRELIEENAVLRKAGADFGHLAERLSLALQEERRRGGQQAARRPARSSIRSPKPMVRDEAAGPWPAAAPALQAHALAASPTPCGRQIRTGFPIRSPRAVKFIL